MVGGCAADCLIGDEVGAVGCNGDGCVCTCGCGVVVLFGADDEGLKS